MNKLLIKSIGRYDVLDQAKETRKEKKRKEKGSPTSARVL